MPRERKTENKGLPKRWRFAHNAYYYQVPPGEEISWDGKKLFRLGSTLPEAYSIWAERINHSEGATTIAELLDEYAQKIIPTKKITTQAHNRSAIKKVRAVFGGLGLSGIKPRHIYQYVERSGTKVGARREIEILSHAFTKAVQWGYIDKHPFKGEIRLDGEKARTRYIEDWEIIECLTLVPKRKFGGVLAVQAYIRLAILTGLRRGDLLRLTMADLKEDGIHVTPGKTETTTGKRLVIGWSEELKTAVKLAKQARPVNLSPFLFCNRLGKGYFNEKTGRAGGWESAWKSFLGRVMSETKVSDHFTEHDLRAKCSSDADTLEHAQQLLSHADATVTEKIYRRKPKFVKPLR